MPAYDTDEIQISLPDIFQTIWELRVPATLLTVIGGILGFLVSAAQPVSYITTASMIVTAKTSSGLYQNENSAPGAADFAVARNLSAYVQFLATTDLVLSRVAEENGVSGKEAESMVAALQAGIEVSQVDETTALIISLSWENSQQAQALLDALMHVLPGVMLELLDIGAVNVVDEAGQAKMNSGRGGQALYPLIGMAGGFAVICVISVIYSIQHPRVRDERSLKDCGVEFLGRIPRLKTKDKGESAAYLDAVFPLESPVGEAGESDRGKGKPDRSNRESDRGGRELDSGNRKPDSGKGKPDRSSRDYRDAEKNRGSYARLAAVLRHELEYNQKKIIAVASANPGEGKTTVTYNLALSMQETGCRVLLLDYDFRHGSLYQYVKRHKGYDGDKREPRDGNLRKFLEQLDSGIYTVVGFAKQKIFRGEGELAAAIRELADDFEVILIDTPAIRLYPDILQMGKLADGVLLVVREDMATVDAVYEAVKELTAAGIDIVGGVLNCV